MTSGGNGAIVYSLRENLALYYLSVESDVFFHHILSVIHAEHIDLRSKTNRGLRYKPDVNSHRVTLDCIVRAGPNMVMRYRLDARITARIR